jgi:methylisocitrate lyase
MKSSTVSPGRRLRHAWGQETIAIPGVYNALVARIVERLGFQAVYLSGGALSAASGLPDIGLLSVTEFVTEAQRLAAVTTLPILADADTGFGEPLNVERAVHLFEAAGVAGIHIEDQQLPKRCGHLSGKQVVDTDAMVAKVKAAVSARRDPDFVIMARTDSRGVLGFEEAVKRAKAYMEAGADAIFPEALEGEQEFEAFARAVDAPLLANMTEFGRSPLLDRRTLASLGYRMVLYPLTAFRAALRATEDILKQIKDAGHQRNGLPRMLNRLELYDYLGYAGYEERDKAYFGGSEQTLRRPESKHPRS